MLDRGFDKPLDFRESDDLVELFFDFLSRHAQNCPIEEYIFPSGQVGMETGPDLQQAGDTSAQDHLAAGRPGNSREDLEQGGFARSISSDNADHFASLHFERDFAERPELVFRRSAPSTTKSNPDPTEFIPKPGCPHGSQSITLGQLLYLDDRALHFSERSLRN